MQSTLLPAQTATAAPSPSLTTPPPLPQLAPFSGAIPSIPNRFATAAATGEFVDFNELLHVLEVDGGEEPPISLQVGDGQHLEVPRKPRKRAITTFSTVNLMLNL